MLDQWLDLIGVIISRELNILSKDRYNVDHALDTDRLAGFAVDKLNDVTR